MERGSCTIASWKDFKKELKKQFYPEHAERDARAKLHHLTQKGSIRDYVKEFSEALLEIPDSSEKNAFFNFMDGLNLRARMEIERRGAQDLATAMSIAEFLLELKKIGKPESFKDKSNKGKSGGEIKEPRP